MYSLKKLIKCIKECDLVFIQIEKDTYLKLKETQGYNPMKYGSQMSYYGVLNFIHNFKIAYFKKQKIYPIVELIKFEDYNKEVLDAYLLMERLKNASM